MPVKHFTVLYPRRRRRGKTKARPRHLEVIISLPPWISEDMCDDLFEEFVEVWKIEDLRRNADVEGTVEGIGDWNEASLMYVDMDYPWNSWDITVPVRDRFGRFRSYEDIKHDIISRVEDKIRWWWLR